MTSTTVGRCLRARRSVLAATSALATFGASPAFAQYAPVRQSVDGNGVELFSGIFMAKGPTLSLGQGDQALSYSQSNAGAGWSTNLTPSILNFGTYYLVYMNNSTERFTGSGTTFTSTEGNGSTITVGPPLVYTSRDGTKITFGAAQNNVSSMVMPNGTKYTYSYDTLSYCTAGKQLANGYTCTTHGTARRLAAVTSSNGYRLTPAYDYFDPSNFDPDDPSISPGTAGYSTVTGVTASNLAVSGGPTPTQSFGNGLNSTYVFNDPMGRTTTYRMNGGQILGITLPGDTSESITVGYTSGRVTSVATPAGTTAYASSDASGVRTVNVTDPLSHVTTYKFNIASQRMTSVTDANNHTTTMEYDTSGRVTKTTQPEGNYTQLTYDSRGNATERRGVAKTGSGLADIVLTAGYDTTCANMVTCNKPNWTKDAKGNQTDYTYDSTHGGVLTATLPAATAGGVRPQTRYSYTALQAYYDKGSGIVASGQPTYRLTSTSTCQTGSSCAGTSDEIKTTIAYGPQSAGIGNNLLPVSLTKGSGDGALTATSAATYDSVGNTLTVDGPLPGTADTTRPRYNADREVTGIVSPDPDGAGSLTNRAVRNTIDSRGLLIKTETGTVANQSDTAWAAFAPAQVVDVTYDTSRRVTTKKLSSGGTAYALTQTTYMADGRVNCVATRMNSAAFASLPASACTLGTEGSDGPDRITQYFYDPTGQVQLVQSAVGTSDPTNNWMGYTANDKLAYLKDGESNLTTYVYDGFDRLGITQYPSQTKGAGTSNSSDYEQLTYDPNSNVTARRLRDGNTIAYGYDSLNRLIALNSSVAADRGYSYDLLGRLSTAWFQTGGQGIVNSYDALGRLTSSLTNLGGTSRTMSYLYDLAGNRTRMVWWDGVYVDYDRLATGELSKVRLNGATSGSGVLSTIGYDNLGRRTSLSRGNGTVTSYGYDPVSRLTSLTQDLAGTANDLTITYGYNAASQIVSQVRSNDVYSFTGNLNVNRPYVSNGRNQYVSAGPVSFSYDARGNVTSDQTYGFGYDGENKLVSVAGAASASLSYDPLGRLDIYNPGSARRFIYDGVEAAAELDSNGAIARRYVRGDGADELLVEFVGGATTDPRYIHADERGSTLAGTDASGAAAFINRYDEYGIPGSANAGRFQYTGQMWLPEIGLQYSKARIYSPTLGRFLQTDPLGYADGPNLYNYVGSDPVNRIDPNGLTAYTCTSATKCTGPGGTSIDPTKTFIGAGDTVLFGGVTYTYGGSEAAGGVSGSGGPSATDSGSGANNVQEIVITAHWRRQQEAGNPIAGLALQLCWTCLPAGITNSFAKELLVGAISHRPIKGRYPNASQVRRIYNEIRIAILNADQMARMNDTSGVLGLLSPGQIYDYHVAVFSRFGLPATTFGGSPLFGTRTEAYRTNGLFGWCSGCDQ